MASTSRESVRDALATLFSDNLTGDGQPTQVVYNYEPSTFNGRSPVTTVTGAGVRREDHDYGEEWNNIFYLEVSNYTLYADAASSYTEADAEDALDDVEQAQANLLKSNRSHPSGTWQWIIQEGRSRIVKIQVGGDTYLREIFEFRVEIED